MPLVATRTHYNAIYWRLILVFVCLVATVVAMRGIGDPTLGVPDADRILMDGVFVHDILRDRPWTSPYQYVIDYYVTYPALSIGYRPPFFPLLEGLANSAFGVNIWSSRLALLALWLTALIAWCLLLRRELGDEAALWGGVLLATNPAIVQWSWYTMAELPALAMVLLAATALRHYLERPTQRSLLPACLLLGLAWWTKQTALFAILWFAPAALLHPERLAILRRRDTWLAAGVALAFALPLLALTLWLGEKNIAQSVGSGVNASPARHLDLSSWTLYLRWLWQDQLAWPVLLLAITGIGLAWRLGLSGRGFYLLWIVAVYLFFSYLIAKNPRYVLFWLPPILVFALLPLALHLDRGPVRWLLRALLVGVIAMQLQLVFAKPLRGASGYREAAQAVVEAARRGPLFFDGYNNGYFIYFVRQLDPHRRFQVLRGDKLLSSSAITPTSHLRLHASNNGDILRILNQNGVEYLVVEDQAREMPAIHATLRELLREGPFQQIASIPVDAVGRPPLDGLTLLIYRYIEARPAQAGEYTLELPTVGQSLRITRPGARPTNEQEP